MSRSLIVGNHLPDERLVSRTESSFAGAPIGILLVEDDYAMLPGNVANASTYDFPVIYQVLEGVTFERIAVADPGVLGVLLAGGEALIAQGVRAVVSACGSFANYQRAAAAALPVPVYLSSMLQAPWIQAALQPEQKLLVIAAVGKALTSKVFEECNITDTDRLLIEQAIDLPELEAMLSPEGFNPARLETELAGYAGNLVNEHPEAGAILLQCSDLPPFAWAMQNATGLPVYDMNTLIEWVHAAAVRRPYDGII
jgi:hypothetical protein